MIPDNERLPLITLKGTAEEIGYGHGKLLAERVRANYRFYTKVLFKDPQFDFKDYGKTFLDVIGTHCPRYALEIQALARGAEMEDWQVTVLNARTEIFMLANRDLLKECTSLYFPQQSLLGQNWDWMRPLEGLMALLDIHQEDGHRIMMMTEPGIIGKIGLNNAGVGVCLNILVGFEPITAMPIHILLRMMLESRTLEEARQRVFSVPTGTYSHALLGDGEGRFLSLEFIHDKVHEVTYPDNLPLHTNHYLAHAYDKGENEMLVDSRARMLRAENLLRNKVQNQDFDEMKDLLLDRAGDKLAICKDYQKVWHVELGTLCTIMMDLKRKQLHISEGNPIHSTFRNYQL